MRKSLSIILAVLLIMSTIFAGCSANSNNGEDKSTTTTTEGGLESNQNEFAFDVVEVTDEKGKTVTEKNGEPVTSEIYVELSTNKKGTTIAYELDNEGEHVTNDKGKEVTYEFTTAPATTQKDNKNPNNPSSKPDDKTPSSNKNDDKQPEESTSSIEEQLPSVPSTKPTTATTTMKPEAPEEVGTTSGELTTIKRENEKVPSTSDKGKKVTFSTEDQQTIKQMLEVPYLYNNSYENADGVPIEIATHAAIWMVQREAFNTTSYASSTVVLDLFKFFAQTVVNFKTYCNDANNENITYRSSNDTFIVSSFEAPTHNVTLESIENLGNNNYYKVTASVSGTDKAKKVVAIIQKNRLDSSLGFSIKALKWTK